MTDDTMREAFEKWYRMPVDKDMDIATDIAWQHWQAAWTAAVRATAEECEKKVALARYEGMMEAARICDDKAHEFLTVEAEYHCLAAGECAEAIRKRAEEVTWAAMNHGIRFMAI